ncbi:hypothetical protein EPA93_30420 [Ktedonosporobacter rubrisoli]|uniref:HTH luxR-type domain-containing protein n=1 Tax=Ktedonosporobacter rubrisoli TaxID=2509675 RepID=A0A4P6JYF0_KTERU|nr:LuxR C-terminal-related transcriptional regulator [Ktedonosporobacter rubrisoli]QBD80066.1 hypothetical protein EPA93_30420 [Ktedonosporobacter rubrisoli]
MAYLVQENGLVCQSPDLTPLLSVETPQWYSWLAEITAFMFTCSLGSFTARKEQATNGRGGAYWKAYRKCHGKLYRVYLGKTEHLTLARLQLAATKLSERIAEQGTGPVKQPSRSEAHTEEQHTRELAIPQLLSSRLLPPPVLKYCIARPRLLDVLQAAHTKKLVLIAAPAGSGKTTLLSEWAQHTSTVLWITLDAEDNDPISFWSYILASFQRAFPGYSEQVSYLLSSPRSSLLRAALIELLNTMENLAAEVFLLLDDYQLIQNNTIHETLLFFLEHLPSHMHMIIASRYVPPWPLGRLRASGSLLELGSAELRFTHEEVTAFLARQISPIPSTSAITKLEERTEGWAAGLQLAALALQQEPNIKHFFARFSGRSYPLRAYLLEEVVARQPEEEQRFLLYTSIVERFSAELSEALTGDHNAYLLLQRLQQKKLFIYMLDEQGEWYRYHHLLTEALRNHLRTTQPELFRQLYRRASIWYEQRALLAEAVESALVARDYGRAMNLIASCAPAVRKHGEHIRVLGWLGQLPEAALASQPTLQLMHASTLIASGRLDEGESRLQRLEKALAAMPPADREQSLAGPIATLRAALASTRGDMQKALEAAHDALANLPADDLERRGSVYLSMGNAYFHRGDFSAAQKALAEAVAISRHIGNISQYLETLHLLAYVQILQSLPCQANESCLQGLRLATAYGLDRTASVASLYMSRGDLLYEWNELEAAAEQLTQGIELSRRGENLIGMIDGSLTLAQVRQAQGDMQGAQALMQRAEQFASQTRELIYMTFVARLRVYLWLLHGDVEAAARCADNSGLYAAYDDKEPTTSQLSFFALMDALTLARLYLAQEELARAHKLLSRIKNTLDPQQHTRRYIQWGLLKTLSDHARHKQDAALRLLEQILQLAEPAHYVRAFLDFGSALAPLLTELLQDRSIPRSTQNYARNLLISITAAQPQLVGVSIQQSAKAISPERLSLRELAVLRLLAQGLSNREIAQRLIVTEYTAKTHTRHIYRKLNVHSRTQAIARAQELHIL